MYAKQFKAALKKPAEYRLGSGAHGTVFHLPGVKDVCAKQHKSGYKQTEYDMLRRVHSANCSVPEPRGELVSEQTFFMRIANGLTVAQHLGVGARFSQEIIDDCVDIVVDFNKRFTHGHLTSKNIILENAEYVSGVIVGGYPVIIDHFHTQRGCSQEWRTVRPWFKGRVAS